MTQTPNDSTPVTTLKPGYDTANAALKALGHQVERANEHAATWQVDSRDRLPDELSWLEARRRDMADVITPLPDRPHLAALAVQVRREHFFRSFDLRVVRYRLKTRALRARYTLICVWRARWRILTYGVAGAGLLILTRTLPALVVILDWLLRQLRGLLP